MRSQQHTNALKVHTNISQNFLNPHGICIAISNTGLWRSIKQTSKRLKQETSLIKYTKHQKLSFLTRTLKLPLLLKVVQILQWNPSYCWKLCSFYRPEANPLNEGLVCNSGIRSQCFGNAFPLSSLLGDSTLLLLTELIIPCGLCYEVDCTTAKRSL